MRRHRPRGLLGAQVGDQVGVAQGVAGADARDAPELRQAAQHEHARQACVGERGRLPGHGVHERLVDHHDASRTDERTQRPRRVQHAGRVGRVADDHEVSGVGDGVGLEGEVVPQEHVARLVPGLAQGHVGLGELRVHDDRVLPGSGPCEQREGLGGAGGGQHLLDGSGVPVRHGRLGLPRVGVATDVLERATQRVVEPRGSGAVVHVDGEVDEAVRGLHVAVVAEGVGGTTLRWSSSGAVRYERAPRIETTLDGSVDVHVHGCVAEWSRYVRSSSLALAVRTTRPASHGCGEAGGHAGVAGPVGVQVGGVQRRAREPRRTVRARPGDGEPRGRVVRAEVGGGHVGAVELVTGHPAPGRREQVLLGRDGGAVAEREPRGHGGVRRQRADHRGAVERAAQVQQTGALRDGRHARGDGVGDGVPQRLVGRDGGGVHLGEAAAEVQARRALGQRLVVQRVEDPHVAAERVEQLGRLGVPERERPAAGHRDDPTLRRHDGRVRCGLGDRVPRLPGERRRGLRDAHDLVQVDGLGHPRGEPVERGHGVVALLGRHEPEVARRCHDAVVAVHDAEHQHARALERADDLVGVAGGADLVEDDAGHPHRRVERDHAVHERGDGARRRRHVDHEHHGAVRGAGDVGGRGVAVGAEHAVVQAHHALDDREVGAGGTVQQQRQQPLLPREVRIEVAAGQARGQLVVAGVDVVGADLVARDAVARPRQRGHEAGRDGRLPVARRRRGDHQAGQVRAHWMLTTRCLADLSGRRPWGA